MDLKTIVLDSKPAVVELLECDLVYNDGLCVESDATEVDKESWAGAVGTVDFSAAGRAEMSLLDIPDPVQIQNGR